MSDARRHPQAGGVRQDQLALNDPYAAERVVVNEQVAVEIGVVDKWRQVSGSGDCQRAFDHTAQHDLKVVGAGCVDQLKGPVDAATFHQFNVDAIDAADKAWNVFQRDTAFIDNDWDGDLLAQEAQALQVAGGDGLLDKLDTVLSQGVDGADGFLDGPAGIGVNAQSGLRDSADGPHVLNVVPGAYFDLEDRIVAGASCLLGHALRSIEADGEGSEGAALRIEAEQTIERQVEPLTNEVVEGHVNSGFGGRTAPDGLIETRQNVLDEERVISKLFSKALQAGACGGQGVAIVGGGGGFAVAAEAVVGDGDEQIVGDLFDAARDAERRTESELQWTSL